MLEPRTVNPSRPSHDHSEVAYRRAGSRRAIRWGRLSRGQHDRMANAIRALAMDAVEQAKSGHPGLPMGAADIATVLFTRFLKFDPADPAWPDRDRFVLSAGHGSMLIYALLHLARLRADDDRGVAGVSARWARSRRAIRRISSRPALETTTGPLGQGLANAVGMAIAERHLAAEFGDIVDHHTYVLASDGDLMEGISQEAIALAGHLKLNRLIVLFDDNGISIDGPLSLAEFGRPGEALRGGRLGSDARRRSRSGRHRGRDRGGAKHADRPTLIACRTTIGYGAPTKAGKSSAHGSPLGADEIKGAREKLGWTEPPFEIPADVRDLWRKAGTRSQGLRAAWKQRLGALGPEQRAEFTRRMRGELPQGQARRARCARSRRSSPRSRAKSRPASPRRARSKR